MTSVALHTDRAPRERPILFSAPMIRAILDGRKTQTRRTIAARTMRHVDFIGSSSDDESDPRHWGFADGNGVWWVLGRDVAERDYMHSIPCPYGVPGDQLWVRETWHECPHCEGGRRPIGYRADGDQSTPGKCRAHGWRPSIHMPRWASRITLEVSAVRVERLQSIGESDAEAEGVDGEACADCAVTCGGHNPRCPECLSARYAFHLLWDSINAARAPWSSNPWVWVVSFQRKSP